MPFPIDILTRLASRFAHLKPSIFIVEPRLKSAFYAVQTVVIPSGKLALLLKMAIAIVDSPIDSMLIFSSLCKIPIEYDLFTPFPHHQAYIPPLRKALMSHLSGGLNG